MSTLQTASSNVITATYSVGQFGAVGDGVHDDTMAIAAAVAAAARESNAEVDLSCGNYLVETGLPGSPGASALLYFSHLNGLTIKGSGICTRIFTPIEGKTLMEFEDSTQINVSAMSLSAINGPYLEKYGWGGGAALKFSHVGGGSISGLDVSGASSGAVVLTNGTTQTTVSGNTIHDTWGSGIWEDDCSNLSDENCAPSMAPQGNLIVANILTNAGTHALAALSLDDGSNSTGTVVKGNQIGFSAVQPSWTGLTHCIQVNNASDVEVVQNHCMGTPWDGIVVTTNVSGRCSNVLISGNSIEQSGTGNESGSGIVIYNWPVGAQISGVTIAQNLIRYAGQDGIRTSSGSGASGITDVSVEGNTIKNVDTSQPGSRNGIWAQSAARVTIAGNTINGAGRYIGAGIRADSSATEIVIGNNQVTDILGPAIMNLSQ